MLAANFTHIKPMIHHATPKIFDNPWLFDIFSGHQDSILI